MHDDEFEHIHLGGDGEPAVYVGERIRLRSVGIDIGSSTSHLVFSDLTLERQGRHLSSRYVVTRREVVARSPVTLTPYAGSLRIDAERLGEFIADAYRAAGIPRESVDTGAVIITGEAALKENADRILQLFASEAGRFVCATAGPHLESLLSAHGSGAVSLSLEEGAGTVLNVDIGGGTTKLAVCRGGRVEETAALHLGARLLAWDGSGTLIRVEEAGRRLARELGYDVAPGGTATEPLLEALAEHMARLVMRAVMGEPLPSSLWITEPLRTSGPFRRVVFSGGVAEYIYEFEEREFGDLGPRLGAALRHLAQEVQVLEPRERIRATCIGASQYTVQVSGNTIYLSDPQLLPLRNVPVAAVRGIRQPTRDQVAQAVRQALARLDLEDGQGQAALAVHWHHGGRYADVLELCTGIAAALPHTVAQGQPLLLILDADVGGLVGAILKEEVGVPGPVLCIDQVALREFDYVDLGAPLPEQHVVPVVVKSLVFH